MAIKVAFIGAGSVGFCRGLFRDIVAVPAFADTQFAFHDINAKNLDMVYQLCMKDIAFNKLPATIAKTPDRRRAVAGADYVINCTRIGGLEAFKTDIDIPLKYGVDQCVGDTLCAGGIMYGQRNIPQVLAFCKDIRETAKDDVLLLNYANPNAMNTWAAIQYGKVNTVGLCHGVMGGHHQITEVIKLLVNGDKKPGDRGYREISHKEVDIICAGINHQTWYVKVLYDGKDWTGRLLEGFQKHPGFRQSEKVRIDVLKRFGYYSTESNGHLSEYVPWYRKRLGEIKKWIDLSCWINGETGGYLRVCTEGRNWFNTDFPMWMKAEDQPIKYETRGQEHGSYIMEGLETGKVYRGHFNVRNNGCITNLADDCIVEVPGYVDHNGINIPRVGDLPMACAATLSASINVQRMAVKAAVEGNVTLLKQAMLHDPLTAAVCDPEEIWQMTDEFLIEQAQWLPNYKKALPAAKASLAAVKKNGTYKGTRSIKGVARLHTKTVAEMRKEAAKHRAQAAASDKAAAQRAKEVQKATK
jgi:alpha-galactosidase